jgi:hypothetical protein
MLSNHAGKPFADVLIIKKNFKNYFFQNKYRLQAFCSRLQGAFLLPGTA